MKKLNLKQMENVQGGGDILKDKESCEEASSALNGAALIFGVASWWTGVGAGVAVAISAVAYVYDGYCDTL